jgi:drug/metabolite transporter (DMT)-like permease
VEKGTARAAALAPWFLVLCAVLWSSSGLVIKLTQWQALSILGLRSFVAGLVVVVFVALRRLRGADDRVFRAPLTRLELLGAACYFGTQLAFVTSTKLTTAANAVFLQYTAPLYVLLFGWLFLRERPRRADLLTMPLVFAGLLLFLGNGLAFGGAVLGDLLAALSGALLAGMMICTRGQGVLPARTFLIGMLAGTLVGLPSLLRETFTVVDFAMVAYLGVFQMGLALVFYSLAIVHVPALEATLILTLEPVLNPVWVFLVIGEKPGPLALLGGLSVVAAVVARAALGSREESRTRRAVDVRYSDTPRSGSR